MGRQTTLGQLMLAEALPEDMRDRVPTLDKGGVKKIFNELADRNDPDEYRRVSAALYDIGRKAVYGEAGMAFGLQHLRTPASARSSRARLNAQIRSILSGEGDDEGKEKRIIDATRIEQKRLEKEVLDEAVAGKNPLGLQVVSGSRGKAQDLKTLLAGDHLYTDAKGREIPFPVQRSYAEGLMPAEFYAGSFGARKGLIGTKLCLAAGTPVRMADGSEKPIEQVRVGDLVAGFCTKAESVTPVAVTNVFDQGVKECGRWKFGPGLAVDATKDHQILGYDPRWHADLREGLSEPYEESGYFRHGRALVRLEQFSLAWVAGYRAVAVFGDDDVRHYPIAEKRYEPLGHLPTYDIEVDHPDHLFVLANGLIVSNSVADGGDLSKRLVQAVHQLMVVAEDDDGDGDPDRGLPADVEDNDNIGSLLARDAGPFKRNTVIDSRVLGGLRNAGVKRVLVRSPIVGGPDSGVYGRDVGVREKGRVAPPGDNVGIAASQSLSERLTQSALGSKHGGGVAGGGPSGLPLVNQLVEVPGTFRGGASHAELDGKVDDVRPAPQGGFFVTVGGKEHFVDAGREVTVKAGDRVEAGDTLSSGIPNPAKVVEHKGIGEGRRAYIGMLMKALGDAGVGPHRRNVELAARGLIDHVELTEETDDHIPGDVVSYQRLERGWQPREGHREVDPASAVGMYLEKPVLHHSIGTKIKPSMLPELNEFGLRRLLVHDQPPPFEPVMVRASMSAASSNDWQTRFLGGYQEKSLLRAVHRGDSSDTKSTSFVPALAEGSSFGSAWPGNVIKR